MPMYESRLRSSTEKARRAKEVAVAKQKANDLAGAKEFAVKAKNLNPALTGLLCLTAVLDVMIGFGKKINDEVDWYSVLAVEPTADVAAIKDRYRKLSMDMIMDSDESVGSIVEASNILANSWRVLCNEKKRRAYDKRRGIKRVRNVRRVSNVLTGNDPSSPSSNDSSFWTRCPFCSFKYRFHGRYKGHSYLCVKCSQAFEVIENPMSSVDPRS